MKVSTAKRKAAGTVFLTAFGVMNSVSHMLTFNHLDWETSVVGDQRPIFTDAEQEHINKLKARLHQDGEALRKMGWRLMQK